MRKLISQIFNSREEADIFVDRQIARRKRVAMLATSERILVTVG